MRETLNRKDLLQGLLSVNQALQVAPRVDRAVRIVAGLLGCAIELVSLPEDCDILPDLPQLVQQALMGQDGRTYEPEANFKVLLRELERSTGRTLANFEAFHDEEETVHKSLELIYDALFAAIGNEFVCRDVCAMLRANRYMAEREAATFCRSAVGTEVIQLTTGNHAITCCDITLQTMRDGNNVVMSLSRGEDTQFVFEWSGIGCTIRMARGAVDLDFIRDAFGPIYFNWRPENFFEF